LLIEYFFKRTFFFSKNRHNSLNLKKEAKNLEIEIAENSAPTSLTRLKNESLSFGTKARKPARAVVEFFSASRSGTVVAKSIRRLQQL